MSAAAIVKTLPDVVIPCTSNGDFSLALADPDKMGAKYWHYTVNEMGLEDVTAQVDHIHVIKCGELNVKGPAGMVAGPLARGFLPASTVGSATLDAALG